MSSVSLGLFQSTVIVRVMFFRSSLLRFRALTRPAALPAERERLGLERVRSHMLQMLSGHEGADFHRLAERVRYADELESLWYLRQDLLAALSTVHGEAAAARKVAPLKALFRGLLPAALTAAPIRQRMAA